MLGGPMPSLIVNPGIIEKEWERAYGGRCFRAKHIFGLPLLNLFPDNYNSTPQTPHRKAFSVHRTAKIFFFRILLYS